MKIILLLLISLINLFPQNTWYKLSGPEGCYISALIMKGDTIIAGVGIDKTLIFYSTDKGNYWQKADLKIRNTSGNSAVSDFILTNDRGVLASISNNGIYKSYDLFNWKLVLFSSDSFSGLGKDMNGIIYVGTNSGKIFASNNDGSNWNFIGQPTNDGIFNFYLGKDSSLFAGGNGKILKKEKNSNIWIIKSFQHYNLFYLFDNNRKNIFTHSSNYIFHSSDNGNSWIMLDTSHFFYGNYIVRMIYNQRLIAACQDETGLFGNGWGIALSDDDGLTWRWNNNGLPPKFAKAGNLVKSGNDTYVGTNAAGVFKSTDFGESWFAVNNGLNASEIISLIFGRNGNLYATSWSNGIFKSTDKGNSWKLINNGCTDSYFYGIVQDNNTGTLLVSSSEVIYRSTNDGESWTKLSSPGSSYTYYLKKDKQNRIYSLGYGGGLYRTTNLGDTWTRLDQNFISGYVIGFAVDSSSNIYAGVYKGAIYKSTNDGTSWTKVYQSPNTSSFIWGISVAPNGSIFAANYKEGVLRSTDNGQSWTIVRQDQSFIDWLPINVNKKGEIYTVGGNDKTYYSTDNGNSWIDITGNMNLTAVRDIIFDDKDNAWVGTDESVWTNKDIITPVELNSFIITVSSNNIELKWSTTTETNYKGFEIERMSRENRWEKIAFIAGNGTTSKTNHYTYTDKNLLPGKYSYRLKQIDLDGTSSYSQTAETEIIQPVKYSLEQNYPNPFNPTTEIRYSIASASFVKLRIYDILGKEVAAIVNEEKQPGNYTEIFNAKTLTTGVYFYKLEAGLFTSIKKMLLIK